MDQQDQGQDVDGDGHADHANPITPVDMHGFVLAASQLGGYPFEQIIRAGFFIGLVVAAGCFGKANHKLSSVSGQHLVGRVGGCQLSNQCFGRECLRLVRRRIWIGDEDIIEQLDSTIACQPHLVGVNRVWQSCIGIGCNQFAGQLADHVPSTIPAAGPGLLECLFQRHAVDRFVGVPGGGIG